MGSDNKFVQQTDRERVVPVEIFEYCDYGLLPIFSQQQSSDRLIGVLPMLDRIERLKRVLGLERVEQVQDRRNNVFQGGIELQYFVRHLLAN